MPRILAIINGGVISSGIGRLPEGLDVMSCGFTGRVVRWGRKTNFISAKNSKVNWAVGRGKEKRLAHQGARCEVFKQCVQRCRRNLPGASQDRGCGDACFIGEENGSVWTIKRGREQKSDVRPHARSSLALRSPIVVGDPQTQTVMTAQTLTIAGQKKGSRGGIS